MHHDLAALMHLPHLLARVGADHSRFRLKATMAAGDITQAADTAVDQDHPATDALAAPHPPSPANEPARALQHEEVR